MLQGIEYVPLLYTKRAEIRALENLDMATRARLFPILVVRPWPNTNNLKSILPYLLSATKGYRYGFDIDREKRGKIEKEPCGSEFEELFQNTNGFQKYYDLIRGRTERVPVLRDELGSFTHLDEQFDHIDNIHNGIIIRIRQGYSHSIQPILQSGRLIPEDTLFVIDVGWSPDVLQQQAWASQQILRISEWDSTVDVVVMSSSFPNSFSHIEYTGSFYNDDRELFSRLTQQHNSTRLVYGDWGSTRLSIEQGGGTHYDRIDTASLREWTSFRQTGSESGYKIIADRTISNISWQSLPDCWGKNRIQCTSLELPNKIVGVESAIASRINMHLTSQANVGEIVGVPDEPYVDTL